MSHAYAKRNLPASPFICSFTVTDFWLFSLMTSIDLLMTGFSHSALFIRLRLLLRFASFRDLQRKRDGIRDFLRAWRNICFYNVSIPYHSHSYLRYDSTTVSLIDTIVSFVLLCYVFAWSHDVRRLFGTLGLAVSHSHYTVTTDQRTIIRSEPKWSSSNNRPSVQASQRAKTRKIPARQEADNNEYESFSFSERIFMQPVAKRPDGLQTW